MSFSNIVTLPCSHITAGPVNAIMCCSYMPSPSRSSILPQDWAMKADPCSVWSNTFMTDLDQLRREKWHLDGRTVQTFDDARSFVESVGFCMMYPMRKQALVAAFMGAWVGSDQQLPDWQHAFADPRAQDATELMVRLLRDRAAYEANRFDENNAFLVAASI